MHMESVVIDCYYIKKLCGASLVVIAFMLAWKVAFAQLGQFHAFSFVFCGPLTLQWKTVHNVNI